MHASVKTLLSSIVDYAGLFPPARLDLPQAMRHYARYRSSDRGWMLGRFVLPISRLPEFEDWLPFLGAVEPIPIAAIVSKDWELDLERIESSDLRGQGDIAALEFPPLLQPADIESMLPHLPTGVDAFFEIPSFEDSDSYIAVLQETGAAAKVRMGGLNPEAFPNTAHVCQFVMTCAELQVPFKATAGLHHPLHARHSLPNGRLASMHGFLNLAILAALAYSHEVTTEEGLVILHEARIDRFQIEDGGIGCGDLFLTLSQLKEARQQLFRSFGSCSVTEPIEGLKELNLL